MKQHGPWKIKKSTAIYRNDFFTVHEDEVIRPDGKDGSYSTVQLKPGVAVLAVDNELNAYLTKQFRYAVGEASIEVVAGGRDPSETALEAVQRELREELGIAAHEWTSLGCLWLDTSIACCDMELFLARELTFEQPHREGTESIEMIKHPFRSVLSDARDGKIRHAGTVATIFRAAAKLQV